MLTSAQPVVLPAEDVSLRLHPTAVDDPLPVVPRRCGYLLLKGAGEWFVALGLVMASAPIVLILALLVKMTSRGPAFYAQTRLGRNGRKYRIFKLRTMVHDAEAKTGPVWAAKNDCRVTALGRILRDTHLDEFPQLLNVLRGEMALIGPRPERPEIAMRIERELPAYGNRLVLRPGITGLAQMLAPADDPSDPQLRSVRRKLAHDLYYVREVSLLLDLRVACSTACCFLASAVESICKRMVRSYGQAVLVEMAHLLPSEDGLERQ